ncbi:MAG: class I SAM-dependent methyltransferase, partial [Natronomonas sp.]
MRRFSAEYLRETRRGMWEDSREALSPLELSRRNRILDVGCGEGALTRVLAEATKAAVIGCDREPDLLSKLDLPAVRGDALTLPFVDSSFDLVVCQALLINLPDPVDAIEEFARVSSETVG